MTTLQKISKKFPQFWSLAQKIAADLQEGKYSEWPPLIQELGLLADLDFIDGMEKIIPGWQKISTLNDGQTTKHTLLVFTTCLNLPEYQQASAQTRMEIEWAILLHDLDKVQARSDTAHPFRSAAVVAKIMPSLGFELQDGITESHLTAWSNRVMKSQRPDGERMVHDHTHLAEIVAGLHQCWGENTTASRVLKTVLFHQSLPTLKDWGNAVLLTNEELCLSLTLNDMEVLGPLIIADSDSWNIFDEPRMAYLSELRASNAETCERIWRCFNINE